MKSLINNPKVRSIRQIAGMSIAVLALALIATHAFADVSQDLDALGTDSDANQRAAQLDSRSRIAIVQGRTVSMDNRLEFGLSYGDVANGDSYLQTQDVGAQVDYHFNSSFSLGVRYAKSFNNLTQEGEQVYTTAQQNPLNYNIPQIAYPDQTVMGVINWYMLYGKINFFDMRVVQFDIYSLAGYGQVQMDTESQGQAQSIWENTWTAGAGIAFWLTDHVTSRFELRYQSYSDPALNGNNLNLVVATVGIGVLL